MSQMGFTVFGEPVAKGRPRFTRAGRCYTPAKTMKAEKEFGACARTAFGLQREPIEGPISMRFNFIFGMPKSWGKGKRELWEGLPCTKKPDLDNLIKIIDGINGERIWGDDSQVYEVSARKVWGTVPRTEIQIFWGNENEN